MRAAIPTRHCWQTAKVRRVRNYGASKLCANAVGGDKADNCADLCYNDLDNCGHAFQSAYMAAGRRFAYPSGYQPACGKEM
jgi:hypothetical protein